MTAMCLNSYQKEIKGDALINPSQNKHIVIQKSDKGNSIVIVDRNKYIKKMSNFLSNQTKFQKATVIS